MRSGWICQIIWSREKNLHEKFHRVEWILRTFLQYTNRKILNNSKKRHENSAIEINQWNVKCKIDSVELAQYHWKQQGEKTLYLSCNISNEIKSSIFFVAFKSSKNFFYSCSFLYKGMWGISCPGKQKGMPCTWAGPGSQIQTTHNVQIGQDVSLRVLFVIQVNIWPCHHHQLQMFDSCLSPLVQARRRSPPCWTAQTDTRRFKCTIKDPTDPPPLPKSCDNSATSPPLQGFAQLSHFCWCLSPVSSFSNTPGLSK